MHKRGMSPPPVKSRDITSSTLASCITEALNNKQMQTNVQQLQQLLQKEEGTLEAMRVLEDAYTNAKHMPMVTKKSSSWLRVGLATVLVAGVAIAINFSLRT